MQKAISKYWPVFVLPTLIAFIIGFIWPFIWGIYLSFQRFTTVSKTTFVGIQNYINVFQDSTFLHAFGFTAVFTVVSTVLINVCAFAIALVLTRFVPKVFVGIAFDSGGVASGPMTSTFLLPLAMGACTAVGGNVVTDAFGVVAMVAMAPLIAIQIMGVLYQLKLKRATSDALIMIDVDDNAIMDIEEE